MIAVIMASIRILGTHDMIIRNNTVYNNNGTAIICSLIYNITYENNKIYDNNGRILEQKHHKLNCKKQYYT